MDGSPAVAALSRSALCGAAAAADASPRDFLAAGSVGSAAGLARLRGAAAMALDGCARFSGWAIDGKWATERGKIQKLDE